MRYFIPSDSIHIAAELSGRFQKERKSLPALSLNADIAAIIAISISKTENTKELNLIELLNNTKCKKEGIGGIRTYGSMYVGYPR